MSKEIKDPIRPNHYLGKTNNDVIKFCMDNKLGFMEGNIVRYIVRHKDKNGLEDLKKAQEYIRRLIERDESETTESESEKTKKKYDEAIEALKNIPTPDNVLKFNKLLRRDEIDAMRLAFANTPTQTLSDDDEYRPVRLYCPECGGRIKIIKDPGLNSVSPLAKPHVKLLKEDQPKCVGCGKEYVIQFDKYNLELSIIPDPRK